MITISLSIIICVFISIFNTSYSFRPDWFDYILNSILGAFIGFVIGISIAFALPMDTYDKKYYYDIETLHDNSSLKGSFFLGSGNIDGSMKYVFYYQEDSLYRMLQVDYNLVQIKYTNSKPKVNVIESYPTKSWINDFAIDLDVFSKEYIIEVPKGTIKNNYQLDAQ